MKIEKHVEKLTTTHGDSHVINQIIQHIGLPRMLLILSNYCIGKSGTYRAIGKKDEDKVWRKRAKIIHDLMEELLECQPSSSQIATLKTANDSGAQPQS